MAAAAPMMGGRRRNKNKNKSRKNKKMYGGGLPSELSLAQGKEFAELHRAQHGGGQMTPAPIGYDSMLPQELRAGARVDSLDTAHGQIVGMRDQDFAKQTGGARKRNAKKSSKAKKSRKERKASKKSRKNKKSRKSKKSRKASKKSRQERKSKKSRKERKLFYGGFSPVGANTMLLSPSAAAKAGTADFSL
jgi:hypothetical protein